MYSRPCRSRTVEPDPLTIISGPVDSCWPSTVNGWKTCSRSVSRIVVRIAVTCAFCEPSHIRGGASTGGGPVRHSVGTGCVVRGADVRSHVCDATVDEALELVARSGGASWCRCREQARLARRVTQLVRDADDRCGLAGGGLLVERAVARAGLEQRPPTCRADHADESGASQLAGARPRCVRALTLGPGRGAAECRDAAE